MHVVKYTVHSFSIITMSKALKNLEQFSSSILSVYRFQVNYLFYFEKVTNTSGNTSSKNHWLAAKQTFLLYHLHLEENTHKHEHTRTSRHKQYREAAKKKTSNKAHQMNRHKTHSSHAQQSLSHLIQNWRVFFPGSLLLPLTCMLSEAWKHEHVLVFFSIIPMLSGTTV